MATLFLSSLDHVEAFYKRRLQTEGYAEFLKN